LRDFAFNYLKKPVPKLGDRVADSLLRARERHYHAKALPP